MSALEQLIPTGYEQTEVGIIPENWNVESLKEITLDMLQGINTAIDKPEYTFSGIPILKANNVIDKVVALNNADQISKRSYTNYSERFKIKNGDFLFSNIGARLGTGALWLHDTQATFAWNIMRIITNQSKVNPNFLAQLINSPKQSEKIQGEQSGSGMGFIPKSTMQKLLLPLPCIEEQTAIANALSDVDALLTELENLITKKQAIKTATMQQLLTGKTRLPQFAYHQPTTATNDTLGNKDKAIIEGKRKGTKPSELGEIPEDWEVKAFGQVMCIRHGKDQKAVQVNDGQYPIFGTGGQMGTTNTPLYDKPSVLIGRKGTINKPKFIDDPFWTVDTLFYSEVSSKESAKFIYYKFCMIDWMQYNEASGVPSLNASTIENVIASFPELKEQTAIATILSDMDNEIQTLEQRLTKTRQIKQGMMQQLLTGRTRLPFKSLETEQDGGS